MTEKRKESERHLDVDIHHRLFLIIN